MKQRAGLIGGPARVFVPASLEPVVRAYEAAGQPEKAREWRERLSPERWAERGPP